MSQTSFSQLPKEVIQKAKGIVLDTLGCGIAGYTLIYNSFGLLLASHNAFESTQKAIEEEVDIHSKTEILETNYTRIRVNDTDLGREIQKQIQDLQRLLNAYRLGLVKET